MVNGRQRDPFVIYCSLSPPVHPDTHTIYEDNRRARRALLEHSPDGCTRSRQRGRRRAGKRRWRCQSLAGLSPLPQLCVLREKSSTSPNMRAGGTKGRAPPARISRKMPPRHQMSVECQPLRRLRRSPFIFWAGFSPLADTCALCRGNGSNKCFASVHQGKFCETGPCGGQILEY